MFDTLIQLLLSLLLGTAGAAGLGIASDASSGSGVTPASVAEKVAWAKQHAGEVRANVVAANQVEDELLPELDTEAVDGLETAAAALEEAMELAPDAADFGLQTAYDAVTNAPTGADEATGAPDQAPAGAPDGTPAGAPEETPAGPPSELPAPPEAGRP
jgi:hypothetical protein